MKESSGSQVYDIKVINRKVNNMTKPILRIQNLHKKFGSSEVLKGLNLTVDEGEVVVIIGPSGTGKSTLLRCINRLETPDPVKYILRIKR